MHQSYQQSTGRQSFTPSKRERYNQYTPRKRYVKEQEEFSQYHSVTFGDVSPQGVQEDNYVPRSRQLNSSRREVYQHNQEAEQMPLYKSRELKYDMPPSYELEALEDVTNIVPSRPSFRQQRLKKNCGDKQIPKRANYDENKDESNTNTRVRMPAKTVFEEPLTPRKSARPEQKDNSITQKMSALQNKIARLERITPKRNATPTRQQKMPYELYPSYENSRVLFDKEEIKQESMGTSQVTAISQRQSEILSRVSLGRLVEQQEAENQIEMIQDLSYKISTKLQSIIRNFG